MKDKINQNFKQLFERHWSFIVRLNRTDDLTILKEKIRNFINECVEKSDLISDLYERERLRGFVRFWRARLFSGESFPPLYLKSPKSGHITHREVPVSLINLSPLPQEYYENFPFRREPKTGPTLVDLIDKSSKVLKEQELFPEFAESTEEESPIETPSEAFIPELKVVKMIYLPPTIYSKKGTLRWEKGFFLEKRLRKVVESEGFTWLASFYPREEEPQINVASPVDVYKKETFALTY